MGFCLRSSSKAPPRPHIHSELRWREVPDQRESSPGQLAPFLDRPVHSHLVSQNDSRSTHLPSDNSGLGFAVEKRGNELRFGYGGSKEGFECDFEAYPGSGQGNCHPDRRPTGVESDLRDSPGSFESIPLAGLPTHRTCAGAYSSRASIRLCWYIRSSR